MAETLDPSVHIHEGLWINWTRGGVYGITWTLSTTKSTLLTNTLALFVALAGGQLWNVIRFGIHQIRASRSDDSDESRAQQQVVLRNTDTDIGTLRLMLQLIWSRRSLGGQLSFPLLIASLAIFHYGLFMVAGTFSTLASAGSAVLAKSRYCGPYNSTYEDIVVQYIDPTSFETISLCKNAITNAYRNVELSLGYTRECYDSGAKSSTDARCEGSIQPNLTYSQRVLKEQCPFADLCLDGQDTIIFDTQDIDSHESLGINAPPKDRLFYRKRTTCAVLNSTEPYVTSSAKSTSGNIAYAHYGNQLTQETNWTYSYSNYSSLYTEYTAQSTNPYALNTQIVYASSPTMDRLDWTSVNPIPALRQESADVVLFFLSFTGRYFEPVDDPWFAAHEFHLENTIGPIARKQYSQDNTISTLGCTEQYQFCNNRNGDCTPYLGWGQIQDENSFRAGLSAHQNVTFRRIIDSLDTASFLQIAMALAYSSSSVQAVDYCAVESTVMALKLPDDQWQIELRRWYDISLAHLQRTIIQWGTGQNVPNPPTQLIPAQTEPERWFCNNMMIRSKVYQSFSIFTLITITGTGALIILLSVYIERLARWVELLVNPDSTAGTSWAEDHILRLKRASMRASWKPRPPPKDCFQSQPSNISEKIVL